MQHPAIGHDDAKSAVTFREMRSFSGSRAHPEFSDSQMAIPG
jgi:hypothetical protein